MLPALADLQQDFAGLPGLTVHHQFAGVRPVIEGALHSGNGEVVQLVLRRDVA